MSVTEYVWSEVRARAILAFGNQAPGAALEAELLSVFEEAPALVVGTIDAVAAAYKAGKIHSPWAILRARLRDRTPAAEVIVSDADERERAIARAEVWIRAAGVHVDREPELLAALFEDPGERSAAVLARWTDDQELRAAMLDLWRGVRTKAVA